MKRTVLVSGKLRDAEKKAARVIEFIPGSSASVEGELGVGAGVGDAEAGQDKQNAKREPLMDEGKRARNQQ